jgi:hypothetical protein
MFDKQRFYETYKGIYGLKINMKNIYDNKFNPMKISMFLKHYLNIDFYTKTYIEDSTGDLEMFVICREGLWNVLTGEVADIVIRELNYIEKNLVIEKLNKNNLYKAV